MSDEEKIAYARKYFKALATVARTRAIADNQHDRFNDIKARCPHHRQGGIYGSCALTQAICHARVCPRLLGPLADAALSNYDVIMEADAITEAKK